MLSLIEGLNIKALSDPALTGEWEYKLAQIAKGNLSRESFMHEIRDMTNVIVAAAKNYEGNTVPLENPQHFKTPCPKCGGEVVENYRRYACTTPGCDFSLTKHPAGRMFEPEEVEELLATRHVGPLSGFISKMGRPFEAELKLTDDTNLNSTSATSPKRLNSRLIRLRSKKLVCVRSAGDGFWSVPMRTSANTQWVTRSAISELVAQFCNRKSIRNRFV